jgi:CMP/dCMP kinase
MTSTFSVAIDGPVAAGKSTIGRRVADELSAIFFDSGIVYRAVAVEVLQRGVRPDDVLAVARIAESINIELERSGGETHLIANGVDVTDMLRTPEVDRALPPIAANTRVRSALLDCQRSAVEGRNAVVVGRDIGTVILPDAALKIYLDADTSTRASRRFEELRDRGIDITLETVYRDLLARDEKDLSRDQAPLRVADGAIVVNASEKSIEEVVNEILSLASERKSICGSDLG